MHPSVELPVRPSVHLLVLPSCPSIRHVNPSAVRPNHLSVRHARPFVMSARHVHPPAFRLTVFRPSDQPCVRTRRSICSSVRQPIRHVRSSYPFVLMYFCPSYPSVRRILFSLCYIFLVVRHVLPSVRTFLHFVISFHPSCPSFRHDLPSVRHILPSAMSFLPS